MVSKRIALTFRYKSKAEAYREALRGVGLHPFDVTPSHPLDSLEGMDGLVLSGGSDYKDDDARDLLERTLILDALAKDLPVFGICRGLQMLNVVCGGTLHQHIDGHKGETLRHSIATLGEGRTRSLIGDTCEVNSRHHQAIDVLAPGLVVTARAPDGIIEAVELPGKSFVLAVQWHPEDLCTQEPHGALFRAFAEAVSGDRRQS